MKEKIKLTRSFAREHSLFYVYIWKNSDVDIYNIKNVLFVREKSSNQVSVWYNVEELNDVIKSLVKKLNDSKEYFNTIKKKFNKYWKFIEPYFSGKKEIKNIKELEKYYKNITKWWSAMALVIAAPDVEDLSEDIKKELMEIRLMAEKYTNEADNVFIRFFKKNYPQYKDLTYVISPSEVFSLEKKRLTNKKNNEIKKRLKGYALLNDDLFKYDKLHKKLEERGLKIEGIMATKKLVFEKSITRDWGIIYAQLWHKVFVEEFKKQIGWGYTEVVFEGKENTISIYRAPKEHIKGMRDFITKQLDKDPYWLSNHAKKVKEQIDSVIKWSNNIKNRSLNKYTSQELIIIAKTFMKKNTELGPRFIIMLWFPIQMENYNRTDKYKEAIDIAIKTRTDIEKIGPFADTFGRRLSLETAKRMDIPEKLSKYISYEEVLDYLKKGIIVDKKILEKRKKYFIITNKGILYKSIDAYFKKEGYNLKKEKLEGISEIKGQVAYLGLIKGTAKIIRNKEMFNKFKQGDILVTGMTTPDFLPIMKKASAFITDEGGITCHASIVAREMKKPCIIGTKIATKVLKDGDLVEVDANRGIVKIIK